MWSEVCCWRWSVWLFLFALRPSSLQNGIGISQEKFPSAQFISSTRITPVLFLFIFGLFSSPSPCPCLRYYTDGWLPTPLQLHFATVTILSACWPNALRSQVVWAIRCYQGNDLVTSTYCRCHVLTSKWHAILRLLVNSGGNISGTAFTWSVPWMLSSLDL